MKFYEVAVGQRFRFQGAEYRKTTPLVSVNAETGASKLIARSATVELLEALDTPPGAASGSAGSLPTEAVRRAFETFYAHCEDCLERLSGEASERETAQARQQLEAARERFLSMLS